MTFYAIINCKELGVNDRVGYATSCFAKGRRFGFPAKDMKIQ